MKKLRGFSFSINIANLEAFLQRIKLTKNLFFQKSGFSACCSLCLTCFLLDLLNSLRHLWKLSTSTFLCKQSIVYTAVLSTVDVYQFESYLYKIHALAPPTWSTQLALNQNMKHETAYICTSFEVLTRSMEFLQNSNDVCFYHGKEW